jgi:hypothetical protein
MITVLRLLLMTMTLLGSGCAVQQKYWGQVSPIFMNETARPLISSTRVVVGLDHDSRMGPPVIANGSSGQQFGILGALIESAIVHNENDAIQDRQRRLDGINKAALEYNIGSKFREAVEKSISPLSWLNISYVVKKHDVRIPEIERMVQTLDEDALLLVDNKYLLAQDYSRITVFSYVALYAKESTLAKIAKDARPYEDPPTLYKNLFQYEFAYDGVYTTENDALAGWSSNEGTMIHRALTASIDELTRQIVADLQSTTVEYRK